MSTSKGFRAYKTIEKSNLAIALARLFDVDTGKREKGKKKKKHLRRSR